jgi:hypothetical protein
LANSINRETYDVANPLANTVEDEMTTEPQGQCPICFPSSRLMDEPYYHERFTMLSVVSTTATQTSIHRPGSGTHPSPRPRLFTWSKHRLQGPDILLLIKSSAQDKGHPKDHTITGTRIHLLSTLQQPDYPCTPAPPPPCGYKRSPDSPRDKGATLHRLRSTFDIGTCLNHSRRLGIHSLVQLVPLLRAPSCRII